MKHKIIPIFLICFCILFPPLIYANQNSDNSLNNREIIEDALNDYLSNSVSENEGGEEYLPLYGENNNNYLILKKNESKDGYIIKGALFFNDEVELYIPNEYNYLPIIEIADYAFINNSNIVSLYLPNTLKRIGKAAFLNCSRLKGEIVFPKSLVEIDEFSFYNCSGLSGSLILPSSLTKLGMYSFFNTSFSGSLVIPSSLSKIEEGVFENCKGFSGELVIPSSVVEIGDYAFSGCSSLSGNLFIPFSVKTISPTAFLACDSLNNNYIVFEEKNQFYFMRDL